MSWEKFEALWQELWAYLYKVLAYFYPAEEEEEAA